MINTVLPPVNNDIYNYPSSEPQRITLRQPNSAVISLDTYDAQKDFDKFTFSGNRLVLGGMKRFSATDLNIFWSGLNVNSTNSLLRFSYGAFSFETTVPHGSYNTPKKLMDALAKAMNIELGSNEISWEDDALVPGFGALNSSNLDFFFLDCPAVKNGKYLWNLQLKPPTTTLTIGQVGLVYSRWIDVISEGLTQYVKNPNTSSSSSSFPTPGNLVGRFNSPLSYDGGFREISRRIQAFQNFEITNDLQTLDISFRDEWGNPLFLQQNNDISLDIYYEC